MRRDSHARPVDRRRRLLPPRQCRSALRTRRSGTARRQIVGLPGARSGRQRAPRRSSRQGPTHAPGRFCRLGAAWPLWQILTRPFAGKKCWVWVEKAGRNPPSTKSARPTPGVLFGSTERRRSRTYPAWGYQTSPVLKTSTGRLQRSTCSWCAPAFCRAGRHLVLLNPEVRRSSPSRPSSQSFSEARLYRSSSLGSSRRIL
jgi:hypothetical protein